MSEVAMIKGGEIIQVDGSCVSAHKDAGWAVASGSQKALCTDLSNVALIMARFESIEARIADLENQKPKASRPAKGAE
jgi:hypothetical protein